MSDPKNPKPPANVSRGEIVNAANEETNIVSAFVKAIQFRTIRSAVAAYNSVLIEQANTQLAFSQLDRARLEAQRSIELLKDAGKIHETDQLQRDLAHLEATERLRQMQHEGSLVKMEREAEMRHAQAAFAGEEEREKSDLSEDEHELADAFQAKIKPTRYRIIIERIIKEQNLSDAEETRQREIMEALINRSL